MASKKNPLGKLEKLIRAIIREEIEADRDRPRTHTISVKELYEANSKLFSHIMPKLTKQPKEN